MVINKKGDEMRIKVQVFKTRVGSMTDGMVIGHQPEKVGRDFLVYEVPHDAIVVTWGLTGSGYPRRSCYLADGSPVPAARMWEVLSVPEWAEYAEID